MNLENATKIFSEWRISKQHRSEKIPDHLWDLVRELTKQYSVVVVAKSLGLASAQVRQQMRGRMRESGLNPGKDRDVLPFRVQGREKANVATNLPPHTFIEIFLSEKVRIKLPSTTPSDVLRCFLAAALEVS